MSAALMLLTAGIAGAAEPLAIERAQRTAAGIGPMTFYPAVRRVSHGPGTQQRRRRKLARRLGHR